MEDQDSFANSFEHFKNCFVFLMFLMLLMFFNVCNVQCCSLSYSYQNLKYSYKQIIKLAIHGETSNGFTISATLCIYEGDLIGEIVYWLILNWKFFGVRFLVLVQLISIFYGRITQSYKKMKFDFGSLGLNSCTMKFLNV